MKQTPKNVSPMSNEARNTYVKEHITNAFLKLLSNKPIHEISISELCDLAGVGRASFYRNYNNKESILKSYTDKLFRCCINECWGNSNKPLNESIGIMFRHFETYKEFYSLLYQRSLAYLLKDIILESCGWNPELDKIEVYSKAFFAYTLYGWIEVWFSRGMRESSEEMAQMFIQQGI